MVIDDITALDLIYFGRSACALENAGIWNHLECARARDMFIQKAQKCGFGGTEAAAAAINKKINKAPAGDKVEPGLARTLQDAFEGVNAVLEAEGSRTTVLLTNVQPPAELFDLPARLGRPLEGHQQALLADLVICLKAHLARPAIVMAWALGYDLVRSWIFRDTQRRQALATQLNEPLNNDHDFFHLNEYRVLAGCRNSADAALVSFTDTQLRDLQSLLDQRNDFAHANYNRASINEATAYVERMIRIVTSPPFV